MTNIVINDKYGGFGLSYKGMMRYAELKGITLFAYLDQITKDIYKERAVIGNDEVCHHYTTKELPANHSDDDLNEHYFSDYNIPRDDPVLVRVVSELGKMADGRGSDLKIVEIPDGVDWEITEYDGAESIHEKHRSWR